MPLTAACASEAGGGSLCYVVGEGTSPTKWLYRVLGPRRTTCRRKDCMAWPRWPCAVELMLSAMVIGGGVYVALWVDG